MTEARVLGEVPTELRALPILLLGSCAAPATWILIGYLAPAGFLDFRASDLPTVVLGFISAYFFSALFVVPLGAAFWRVLHSKRLDGFVSYSAIALAAAVITGFSFTGALPSPFLAGMALANALLTRVVELLLGRSSS
jgi:fumarate reductase subunit D